MGIKSRSIVIQLAIVVIGFLVAGCGDDGPTKPTEPRLPKFYINGAANWNQIYVYDLKTDSFSTLVLPLGPLGGQAIFGSLAGSSRRHCLYLGDHSRTGVYDLDLDSLIDVRPLGSFYGIAVSPDDRFLALCGDSLMVVRSSDFSVVFHDSARGARPVFSRDSHTLYAVEGRTGAFAFIVRFQGDSVTCQKHSFPSPIWRIRPSNDNKLWFLYVNLGNYQFGVGAYDPAKDSLVARTTTSPGLGDLECTPDGQNLIYSSPGGSLVSGPVSSAFYFVDLKDGYQVTQVSPDGLLDQADSTFRGFRPAEMAMSSDGHYLASVPPAAGGAFVVYDLWARKYVHCWNYNRVDRSAFFMGIVCIN